MSKIKCQCGHENPFGTVLCEQCGRPQTEEAKNSKTVDMRYEGSARRSQTYKRTIVDKIWNFFSSVKIGISIIIAVLVTSAIGTIFPQKLYVPANTEAELAAYYERLYGVSGVVYYKLGFHDMYNSWWFITLVGMLGTSILIASIDRVIPLYKSLKQQRTKRHTSFLKRQRVYGHGTVENADESLTKAEEKLKQLRYQVKVENGAILAEKNRFSRWGPYVNHTGLLIFLGAVLLRGIPGFYVDETLWLREGEKLEVPGAPGYFIENKGFTLETYSEEDNAVFETALERNGTIVKEFQTDIALYKQEEGGLPGQSDNISLVKEYPIVVNKPLTFDGYSIFQMDYRTDELKSMTFQLTEKSSEKSLGEFTVDLVNPDRIYDLGNGASVELRDYYPDYDGFVDGEPTSKTPLPNNPAFFFKMITPEKPKGEISFVAIRQTVEAEENDYKVNFLSAETRNISGLTIRKDKTLYLLLLGGIIFMIGVAQGSYWNHRRIWIQKGENNEMFIASHTNKNWFSLKKEMAQVKEYADLPKYEDREDTESVLEDEEGDFK
ncbi:cytochrome c biogenesis protein ResB [Sporosarcina pasteurii]|uniref:Cytochrome c biogenesis protein CcsB n=1 Tax=Sporosarcina pasteurii TaxID=1474 RepID=A0A380BKF6_SPOPA|nr:cytochrome c biogenesis protein ResB [Sporosarcina pasteurii]MDS9470790.1 cytochrome c biogenesis protein ResB [Sporosarcina pasteurii]QBQ05541.1 cytochrome C biogenesis protein [Sporosarcina pasteurii]SUJ02305.1 Cytochrome c biogenesis protein CcsB [Sporosarcina pasteurii]